MHKAALGVHFKIEGREAVFAYKSVLVVQFEIEFRAAVFMYTSAIFFFSNSIFSIFE